MAEYGMDYKKVRELPLRTFWSLNRQVDRLRAEKEQRLLRIHSAAEHPETVKALADSLNGQIATPVIFEKKFDADRFETLRQRLQPSKEQVVNDTHTE
jgi:hypothetical protein